jgi:hypothetical protein
VDAARGAGALVADLRALRMLAGMTKAEAGRAGVDNPYRYFRVFSGKLNMAPREDKSDWHFLESVDLGSRGKVLWAPSLTKRNRLPKSR